ncbi:MAG: FAD-dependent oxidoreductase [Nocardioidaceae bacterium]|nr:FAD-dependent oxidoreductase [Nocardioidaceae bacterium]
MPHVVTQSCCADASCVLACPVNCIHPAPGEPGFGTAEMLYIDAAACVDCGACTTACPVGAIDHVSRLTPDQLPFVELNADYFVGEPHAERTPLALVPKPSYDVGPLRVAIVGAGPAGLYAADELLKVRGMTVHVYDRLLTPHGLVRAGVAPDHVRTKRALDLFAKIEQEQGFDYRLGVEVGTDITHAQLRASYDAVLYSSGAATDRRLGVPGEDLPGSVSATELVAWYNGHPDRAHDRHDLNHRRAVVVGNGNVALDVARVLTLPAEHLAATDISDIALAALRESRIEEVVVLGRRGPDQAAFTLPELVGLTGEHDIDIVVEGEIDEISPKTRQLAALARREPLGEGRRRIVFRFLAETERILGDDRVTGVEVERTRLETDADGVVRGVRTGETEVIEAGLVVRSVGYRARPVPDLPFDEQRAVVPNDAGRVEPGTYVAGWIKRGPNGFIGTNKTDATETVASLLADAAAGLLPAPTAVPPTAVGLGAIDLAGWQRIATAERRAGAAVGRPRVKLLDRDALGAAARV